ncbi:MAG: ABC transporter permease [Candidatus Cloacimonetes bacterium]|nr:ABC transporter permease [Candidatus Cloacimonadota bacterium]
MIGNYLKLALRNMLKNKLFSLINIAGLSLGMAISLLLLFWVRDELMFDRFHSNEKNIYQISMVFEDAIPVSGGRTIPYKMVPVLREKYSEVKNATRIRIINDIVLQAGEKTFRGSNFLLAEPQFLEMFTFPLLSGDPQTALIEPTSIIMTRSAAAKFFGEEPALGKTLLVNNSTPFTVTGVIEDCPVNSTLSFDYIIPFSLLGERADTWSWECSGFVELHDNVAIDSFNEKIRTALVDNSPRDIDKDMLYLQPLSRVHLYSPLDKPEGVILVYIFSAIGIIILIIACINFINLTTARSMKRAREVGIRKVIGAQRKQLIRQFLFESMLMSLLALILSLILIEFLLPQFNMLTGKSISLDFNDQLIMIGLPVVLLLTGLMAGIFPAVFMSSFHPLKVLKLYFNINSMNRFRRLLVVFQFTISIALIIVTFVIVRQLNFINNKDLGLKKDSIILMPFYAEYHEKFAMIKEELLKNSNIKRISAANTHPARVGNVNPVSWEGKPNDDRVIFNCIYADKDYLEMFEIPFVAGGNFLQDTAQINEIEYIVNETAVRMMGMTDPVGKKFSMFGNDGYIVGVVQDFHNKPLTQAIQPQLISQLDWFRGTMFISLESNEIENTLAFIEDKLNEIVAGYPFEYDFLDESIQQQYRSIERSRLIMSYFAFLAVFISGLGLFGLSSYVTEQKSREISIRKVFGSSVKEVVSLLSARFLRWVAIATILAVPVAWYISRIFLKRFAYHIDLTLADFALPILAQLIIALLAVCYYTLKTALSNPANILKYE